MIIKLSIIILTALNISACRVGGDNTKETVEQIKATNVKNIEQLPPLSGYQKIDYTASNLQDPFFPRAINRVMIKNPGIEKQQSVIAVRQNRPDYDRPREYLENYSLDSLTMVGTLKKRGEMWGLVVDKSGIIHRVKSGNYMGQNSGKITDITEENIAIKEIIPDSEGGWTTRDANIGLRQ